MMKLTIHGYKHKKENKYYSWYCGIIMNRILNPINEPYSENHHILPKSLGGDNSQLNLIRLTAREHFIVHALLPKFITGSGKYSVLSAHIAMSMKSKTHDRYSKSKIYESMRIEYSKELSKYMKIHSPFKDPDIHKKTMETRERRKSNVFVTNNPMLNEETKNKKMKSMPDMKGRKCWFNTITKQRRQCADHPGGDDWIQQGHNRGITTKAKGVAKPRIPCIVCGESFPAHTMSRHIKSRHPDNVDAPNLEQHG